MTTPILKELFEGLELNSSESAVLSTLITGGPSHASGISKQLKIKRPTVYAALDNLVRRGLAVRERLRSGTRFSAIPRELIPRVIEEDAQRKLSNVKRLAASLKTVLSETPAAAAFQLGGFEVSSFEGTDAVYAFMESVVTSGDFSAFICPQELHKDKLRGTIMRFLEVSAKTKAKIREIAPNNKDAMWYKSLIRNPNHHLRFMPAATAINADIIFSGGAIVLTHYEEGREVLIRITEKHLYSTFSAIFNSIWDGLEVTA